MGKRLTDAREFLSATAAKGRQKDAFSLAEQSVRKKTDDTIAFIDNQKELKRYMPIPLRDFVRLGLRLKLRAEKMINNKNLMNDFPAIAAQLALGVSAQEISQQATSSIMHGIKGLQVSVRDYQRLCEKNTELQRPPHVRWEQDSNDLGQLNRKALDHAVRIVNTNLDPASKDLLTKSSLPDDEIGVMSREWFDKGGCGVDGECTWGKTAQEIVTQFGILLQTLQTSKSI